MAGNTVVRLSCYGVDALRRRPYTSLRTYNASGRQIRRFAMQARQNERLAQMIPKNARLTINKAVFGSLLVGSVVRGR